MGLFKKEPKNDSTFWKKGDNKDKTVIKMLDAVKLFTRTSEEDVEAMLYGSMMATSTYFVVFTKDAIIYRADKGASIYPYSSITGAILERESTFREVITITIGGEQTISLSVVCEMEAVRKCFDFVNSMLKASKTDTSSAASSTADELLKYKNLLDLGAISQEEYDKKKSQLLNL